MEAAPSPDKTVIVCPVPVLEDDDDVEDAVLEDDDVSSVGDDFVVVFDEELTLLEDAP